MENLARPHSRDDFGEEFIAAIISDGSLPVIAPMIGVLGHRDEQPDLRPAARELRPALIADVAHFINISHGRLPGLIDYAAHKIVDDAARRWLIASIDAFAAERRFLNALTVAAGPIKRLAGQDKIAAMIAAQAKNFEMLATSDRTGCPAGAAIAFVVDWMQTRPMLEQAALLINLQPPPSLLPSTEICSNLATDLATGTSVQRAMNFGATQLLAQQRGLWRMIAARHEALRG